MLSLEEAASEERELSPWLLLRGMGALRRDKPERLVLLRPNDGAVENWTRTLPGAYFCVKKKNGLGCRVSRFEQKKGLVLGVALVLLPNSDPSS